MKKIITLTEVDQKLLFVIEDYFLECNMDLEDIRTHVKEMTQLCIEQVCKKYGIQ